MKRKELKTILEEFKTNHPDLMSLKPRVEISPGNSVTDHVPVPQIYVWHPFVFDIRLIPKDYNGVKVTSVTISSTLPECLNPSDDKLLWQVEDPANYVRFVEDNYHSIRRELKSPFMTKTEMLDALTGNFEQHVMDWYRMVSDWLAVTEAVGVK